MKTLRPEDRQRIVAPTASTGCLAVFRQCNPDRIGARESEALVRDPFDNGAGGIGRGPHDVLAAAAANPQTVEDSSRG